MKPVKFDLQWIGFCILFFFIAGTACAPAAQESIPEHPTTLVTITSSPTTPPARTATQTEMPAPDKVTDEDPVRDLQPVIPTSNGSINHPFILQFSFSGDITITDTTNGYSRPFVLNGIKIYEYGQFIRWLDHGCRFISYQDDYDIVETDLTGQITRIVFESEKVPSRLPDGRSVRGELSLSGDRIAFNQYQGTGTFLNDVLGYIFEQQNLYTMSTSNPDETYQISLHGKAWVWEWSPDSNKIIYIDQDAAENLQLYIADWQGKSRTRLEGNFDRENPPYQFDWAPDSNSVAILFDDQGSMILAVANLRDQVISQVGKIDKYWWESDSSLMIWNENEILRMNPMTGQIIRRIEGVPIPAGFGRLGLSNLFGCFNDCNGQITGRTMTVFDLGTNQLVDWHHVKSIEDRMGWIPSPENFPGEKKCDN